MMEALLFLLVFWLIPILFVYDAFAQRKRNPVLPVFITIFLGWISAVPFLLWCAAEKKLGR